MRQVNREVISWALSWNNYSVEDLLSSFSKLPMWLDGSKQPTFKQLERFAKKTHLPLLAFFAETVPEIRLQIADFRRSTPSNLRKIPSPALFDTIDEMLMRQAWMSDFFVDLGYEKNNLAGVYANRNIDEIYPESLAFYIQQTINVSARDLISEPSVNDAFKLLKSAIEKSGVSVSVAGYAKGSTRRSLDVNEFRGFVLVDDYAPIIFINGKDAKCAQLFTLVHELSHLTLGNTGLFGETLETKLNFGEERFCDQVAAEFLMPKDIFLEIWSPNTDNFKEANRVAKRLKVSFVACIRRARDLSLIDDETFVQLFKAHNKEMTNTSAKQGSGGRFYFTKGSNLGDLFTEAIYMGVKSGKLLYSDAYKLTNMKAATFNKYFHTKGYSL